MPLQYELKQLQIYFIIKIVFLFKLFCIKIGTTKITN